MSSWFMNLQSQSILIWWVQIIIQSQMICKNSLVTWKMWCRIQSLWIKWKNFWLLSKVKKIVLPWTNKINQCRYLKFKMILECLQMLTYYKNLNLKDLNLLKLAQKNKSYILKHPKSIRIMVPLRRVHQFLLHKLLNKFLSIKKLHFLPTYQETKRINFNLILINHNKQKLRPNKRQNFCLQNNQSLLKICQ